MAEKNGKSGLGRREFLKTTAVAAAVGALPVSAAPAATRGRSARASGKGAARKKAARGRINGKIFVRGEEKIPEVVVTNGRDCVVADKNGNYTLPVYAGMHFVSVTVPSGFRTDWSFIPYPNRRATYSYDFFLDAYEGSAAGKPCTFVHIADSETKEIRHNVLWKNHLRKLAAREDAAFIVHTGDLTSRYGILGHFQSINFDTMGRPVYYCIGNHDLEPTSRGEEAFEAVNGPCWYSFDSRGVHFVVTPMPRGDGKPSYTEDQVAEWVENDLKLVKKGTPVVFFNHMLSNWEESVDMAGFTYGKQRRIRIGDLCRYSGFVYGHTHHNYMRRVGKNGETVFVCTAPPTMGGIAHDPESFRVITVEPDGRMRSRLQFGVADFWKISRAGAAWETKLRSPIMYSAPLLSEGRLFVGLSDEDAESLGGVAALDAKTGKTLWCADVPGSVFNHLALCAGNIIAQTKPGDVYAFDAASGRLVWRSEDRPYPVKPVQSGLVSDGTLVFTGSPARVVAYDAKTGQVAWREKDHGDKAGGASSDTPAVAEGVLVFSSNWKGIYGYDAKTGDLLWRKPRTEDMALGFPGPTALVRNGRILQLCGRRLYEMDLRTGKTIRKVSPGAKVEVTTRMLPTKYGLVFGSADHGLMMVDEADLKVIRTFAAGDSYTTFAPYASSPKNGVGTAPVAIDEDHVAATATDGAVHVWNLATGKETRKFETGAPYLADVAFDGKTLYAADLAGYVRAFTV